MQSLSSPLLSMTDASATTYAAQARMARAQKTDGSTAAIDKAASDFTGMFMAQMMQPMWEGVEVDSMFGGGHGEEVMRGFMLQEYGKAMAASDTSGLTDAVRAEMLRMQGQDQSVVVSGGTPS